MSKVRLIVTSIISILLVSMLLIGSTYSIFTSQDIDENLNVYTTGNLNIKYSSNNVKFTDINPMTNEEADSVIPHRLTVTNNGNVTYQFDVILSDTTSSESNTIDYQYIMTKVGYLEPKRLSSCTNNIIKEDIILLPGESVDIDVRVWLSDNLANSEMGKSFYAKLSIDGQAIINDNNEIDNSLLSLNYMKVENAAYSTFGEYRKYIKNIFFVDYIDTSNAFIDTTTNEKTTWDMSLDTNKSNSVVAWLEDNGTIDDIGNKYYNLYVGSKEKIYVSSLYGRFYGMSSLETISFDNLVTSLTTTMTLMFNGCISLASLDLSGFNTSNVTTMNQMFNNCTSLKHLNMSQFNTSNVTNFNYMFRGCTSLTNLDLGDFDTSNVTNMSGMFYNCSSLTSLDVSNFNTSSVTNMGYMFYGCKNLIELDLSNFDINNVTNIGNMFQFCISLTSLDVSNFDTGKVTNMRNMFHSCNSLTSLDVSRFNTSSVIDISYMFFECRSLTEVDVSNFNTSSVTNMGYMFYGCGGLTSLDVSNFDTSNVTSMEFMFYNCSSLVELDVSSFDTSNVTNMRSMFYNCSSLVELDVSSFDTSNVTDMRSMFEKCSSLVELDLSNFNTSKVTAMCGPNPGMTGMFTGCSSLRKLDVSNFDISNIRSLVGMFQGCSSLTELDLSNWDTSNITIMYGMFDGCNRLKTSLTIKTVNLSYTNFVPKSEKDDNGNYIVHIIFNYTSEAESVVDGIVAYASRSYIVKGVCVDCE